MAAPVVPTTNPAADGPNTVAETVAPTTSPVAATSPAVTPTTSPRAPVVDTSTAESSAAATIAPVSSAVASSIATPSTSSIVTPSTSLIATSSSTTPSVVVVTSTAQTSSAVPTTSVAPATTQQPSTQVLTITAVSQPGLVTSFPSGSRVSASAGSAQDAAKNGNKGGVGGSGLPVGGLVGIIIGVLAVLAVVGMLVTRSMRKRARAKRTAHRSSLFEPWPAPGPVSMEDEPYEKPAYDAPAQSYPMSHANTEVYDEQAYGAGYPGGQYNYNEYPPQHYANYPGQPYTDMAAVGGAAGVGAAGAAGLGAAGATAGESAAAASGIVDGSMVRVKVAFVRSLEDELAITPGQQLYLHQAYDDGWTLCEDQAQNRGVVPLSCLEPWDESTSQSWTPPADDQTLSAEVTGQRRSSLYAPQQ